MPIEDTTKRIAIFLYGVAVVSFLGGSQIPSVFLKKKSFVIQFGFSATFGLVLLLISSFSEVNLVPLGEILTPFFSSYPIVAIEYLSIPYFFMVLIDLHIEGRLGFFSWKDFGRFVRGSFLNPRRTFEDLACQESIIFPFVCIIMISISWVSRTVLCYLASFTPTRWSILPFDFGRFLGPVNRVALTYPVVLFTWITVSFSVYGLSRKFGRRSSYSEIASVLGFSFLPSLVAVIIDLMEFFFLTRGFVLPNPIYMVLGFLIPLLLWPLILVIFALRVSEMFSLKEASLIAVTVFLPLFLLSTLVLL